MTTAEKQYKRGMNMSLKVGYASANINPKLGFGIMGYYIPRYVKGFLDDLETSAVVLESSNRKIALISVDVCSLTVQQAKEIREAISNCTGIDVNDVVISVIHTHTGPLLSPNSIFETTEEEIRAYNNFLISRIVDTVKLAMEDTKICKIGYGIGTVADRVAYIRRYKMKDGSTMTCPPVNSPEIDHPIGEIDKRVNVIRIDREGENSIVLVNYGVHADTVNGELISADWPGWMRRTLENALDGAKCMFITGAQGDVGSTNVYPKGGDMNDTQISFDNEMKSPGMARFVGRAMAGTVLQVYDKVKYIDIEDIEVFHKTIQVPANVPTAEELSQARIYNRLHEEGRDSEIPYEAMELTTVVAESARMCNLANGPEFFELELTGVRLGDIAMVGIPGEPFTEISMEIKATDGWELVMVCEFINGHNGYFPTKAAYDEGGYEARSSKFKSGVGEIIRDGSKELLKEMKMY